MTDFSKVLGVIASTLQLDASELAESLKDGENWLPDDEVTKKLGDTISGRVRAAKEEQRKRALRESSESLAKWIKAQGFTPGEADADLKGTALLDAFQEYLKSSKSQPTGIDPAQAGKLTRDELAKLPEVQKLITDANAAVVEKYKGDVGRELEKVKSEYTTYKEATEREKIEAVTLQHVTRALEKGNVMLEPTGTKVSKDARIRAVLREIDLAKVRLNDKREPYLIDDHGDPLTDIDFGRPVDFEKTVVNIGKDLYGERGPDNTKGGANPAGHTGQPGANGKYQQEYFFKTPEELSKAMFSEADAARRAKMSEDFNFQQEKTKAAG